MKRSKLFIACSALALLAAAELPACGPFPPDDEAIYGGGKILALFSPWYVPDTLFTGLIDEAEGLSTPYSAVWDVQGECSRIHTEEWLSYLGWAEGEGPTDELAEVLDADDPSLAFRSKILPLVPRQTPADRKTGAGNYMKLMGDAGKAMYLEMSAGWYYGEGQPPKADWKAILKRALQGAGTKDAFLKERYAFQALRAASLSGDPDQALDIYRTHFAAGGGSELLHYRALGWAAHACVQKDDLQTAFGHYVSVFDQCPTLAADALQSIGALGASDETLDKWTEALDNPHRRAIAAYMHALLDPHRDVQRYLEAMLRWEPASPHAVKLVLDMVRSLEAERLPRTFSALAARGKPLQEGTGLNVPDWRSEPVFTDARVARLLQTVRQARAGGAVRYPGLWLAAEAQILFLSGDAKGARAALDKGAGGAKLDAMEQGLLHLEATFLSVAQPTDASWPSRLEADGEFLDRLASEIGDTRPASTFFSALGVRYLAAGEAPQAAMAFSAAASPYTAAFVLDMVAAPEELLALEDILIDPRGAEDAFLAARFPYTAQDARYLAGVRLARRGEYREAASVWEALPGDYWEPGDIGPTGEAPLHHVQISLENTYLDYGEGLETMSKLDAAELLAPYKERLDSLPARPSAKDKQAAAEAAAALGHASLSTAYLGYADVLWQGSLVYTAEFLDFGKWPFLIEEVGDRAREAYGEFRAEYDHLAAAAAWLEKAASLETSREKAARHSLTAIVCWEGYQYAGQYMENPTDAKAAKALADRKNFAKTYASTSFYRSYSRSMGGCPGIDDYR